MDMRKTLIPVEVKELGNRVLEIAGSTEDIDRQQDIIRSKGWKLAAFKKNPVILWAHDYSQPPIGRARKVWIDKDTQRLMFEVEFADAETYEFADTIYKLYKGGFLHATSVGFIPLDWEGKSEEEPYPKWEGNVFTSQELLELSAVPVPANAEALVNARDSGLITVKQFEAVTREPIEIASIEDTEEEEDTPVETTPPRASKMSQEQIMDDIACLHEAIVRYGLSEKARKDANSLADEIKRITDNDISVKIEAEDEAEPLPDPVAIAKARAQDVAEVANLVLAQLRGKRIY